MNRDPKSHRPHTPLLFVLLGVAMFVAATSILAAHIDIATRVLEPVVTTALVAAIVGTRIFVR
jgi:hypothetical protein